MFDNKEFDKLVSVKHIVYLILNFFFLLSVDLNNFNCFFFLFRSDLKTPIKNKLYRIDLRKLKKNQQQNKKQIR